MKLFYSILIFLSATSLLAQPSRLKLDQQLTITNGLSNNSVTCLLQDSRGFVWVGTYNGLNRYDGLKLKVYKNSHKERLLESSRVRALLEDSNGIIWIGTEDGISCYNYATEDFIRVYSNDLLYGSGKGPGVIALEQLGDEVYAFTGSGEVFVFNQAQELLRASVADGGALPSGTFVLDVTPLSSTHFLMSTNKGLFFYNLIKQEYAFFSDEVFYNVTSAQVIDQQTLLLTLYDGVVVVDYSLDGGFKYKLRNRFLDNFTFHVSAIDKDGGLWLGERNKNVRYISSIEDLIDGKPYRSSYFAIRNQTFKVRAVLPTDDHGCWVGTFNKGLYRFDASQNPFHYIRNYIDKTNTLYPDRALNVVPLDSTRFYIITKGGSVNLYDTKTHKNEYVPFDYKNLEPGLIDNMFIDSYGVRWVKFTSSDAFYRFDEHFQYLDKVEHPSLKDIQHFRTLYEDGEGDIWVFARNDIYKLVLGANRQLEKCLHLNDHPYFGAGAFLFIRGMYVDTKYPYVWLGTIHDGLYRVSITSRDDLSAWEIDNYTMSFGASNSLSSKYVSSIIRDNSGTLWLGTIGGGICKVLDSDKTPSFHPLTMEDGMSNNDVQDLIADADDNLWIGTNNGLNMYNSEAGTFTKYYKTDGLPFNEFRRTAEALGGDQLIFSSINGIMYFDKELVVQNDLLPNVVFDEFKLSNQVVTAGDTIGGKVILEQNINLLDGIVLKHNQNSFSIDLISMHFSNPENYYIQHKLSPGGQWITVPSSKTTLNFFSLSPGKYQLAVRASNSANEWTQEKTLAIRILPPWWRTIPMFIIYFLVVVSIILLIQRARIRYLNLNHELELQELDAQKSKEISQAKLNYFSNISHEIKTPVTLINGPANELAEQFKFNADVFEKVGLIQRQARKIVGLINQVHDFQKSDADLLKLNKTYFYIKDLVKEVIEDFDYLATVNEKKLSVELTSDEDYVYADKDKLSKVLNNLLSNAFKFTGKRDAISLISKVKGSTIELSVSDSGRGIAQEDIGHVFELFYHSSKSAPNEGGSGIGLTFSKRLIEMHYGTITVDSILGEGSVFTVKLPIRVEETEGAIKKREAAQLEQEKGSSVQVLQSQTPVGHVEVDGAAQGAHIFFVEDNEDMAKYISNTLTDYYKVTTFPDGKQCYDALKGEWPDIIVSDVMMPHMNGLELCRSVKNDVKTSHIPVVLLTASATVDDKIKGLKDGADAYITKPFDMRFLLSQIEATLVNRAKIRERFDLKVPFAKENEDVSSVDAVFLEKLYALMNENLSNLDIDLNEFAKALFLNRTHFYQKVKALTNKTPFDLLKTYRVEKAAEFLVEQKMSVNEAFWATGFKSKPHFNRVFKAHFDMTPRQYVAEHS